MKIAAYFVVLVLLLPCVVRADEPYGNIPTSQAYVDDEMSKLQPQFDGLGENKLMTYGTTDGAVGSRDIVTTLGTSTTDTTVPTRGAILTGLNAKQNIMNGTAGFVAENTGPDGELAAKPVYSNTNNYKNALVDAETLNNAVINAVNSELIQVPAGWMINTPENLNLMSASRIYLDANVNGTDFCTRSLVGLNDRTGKCGLVTQNQIGPEGNKSGLWGTVMPYGDIVGKSVCSTLRLSQHYLIANATQNTNLDTEFATQVNNNGSLETNQRSCWCKIESIDGEVNNSFWAFWGTLSDSSLCGYACAHRCASGTQKTNYLRAALFDSIVQ